MAWFSTWNYYLDLCLKSHIALLPNFLFDLLSSDSSFWSIVWKELETTRLAKVFISQSLETFIFNNCTSISWGLSELCRFSFLRFRMNERFVFPFESGREECVHVCASVCLCVYAYVYMCAHVCTCVCKCVHMCACIHMQLGKNSGPQEVLSSVLEKHPCKTSMGCYLLSKEVRKVSIICMSLC